MKVDVEMLASIESEGRRLLDAARQDPSRTVPTYPRWTLSDLVTHTASIHARTTQICRDLAKEPVTRPTLPHGENPLDWYDSTLADLIDVLQRADAATRVWGLRPGWDVARWTTRMVVETGVHRWDAEQALDDQGVLTAVVAKTGLDEFTDTWLPRLNELQVLQMDATDLDESWIYGDGPPTAVVKGTASDLFLALMARPSKVSLPEDWARGCAGLPPPPEL